MIGSSPERGQDELDDVAVTEHEGIQCGGGNEGPVDLDDGMIGWDAFVDEQVGKAGSVGDRLGESIDDEVHGLGRVLRDGGR